MREDLDHALRTIVSDALTPGDVVVSWVAIAGVRHVHGGGYVVTLCSDDAPPMWQLRGMLAEAEAGINRGQLVSHLSELDDEADDD